MKSARLRFSLFILLVAAIATSLLTGCSEDTVEPTVTTAKLMLVQAAPAAATGVDLLLDGVLEFSDQSYKGIASYREVDAGTRSTKVVATGTVDPLLAGSVTLANDSYNSLFIAQDDGGALKTLLLEDDLTDPPAGKAYVRFVNLIGDSPALKIGVPGKGAIVNGLSFLDNKPEFMEFDGGSSPMFKVQKDGINGGGSGGTGGSLTPLISKSFGITEGNIYTFVLLGTLSDNSQEIMLVQHHK